MSESCTWKSSVETVESQRNSRVDASEPSLSFESLNSSTYVKRVASLHNLGNTCFINSVLQVLYRTPNFADLISNLTIEVGLVRQSFESLSNSISHLEQTNCTEKAPHLALVRHLNELFSDMRRVESHLGEGDFATAIRPYDVLKDIRSLNPMFGDNLQHDAHELLRCILSHIDDATTELACSRQHILRSSEIRKMNNQTPCGNRDAQPKRRSQSEHKRYFSQTIDCSADICHASHLKLRVRELRSTSSRKRLRVGQPLVGGAVAHRASFPPHVRNSANRLYNLRRLPSRDSIGSPSKSKVNGLSKQSQSVRERWKAKIRLSSLFNKDLCIALKRLPRWSLPTFSCSYDTANVLCYSQAFCETPVTTQSLPSKVELSVRHEKPAAQKLEAFDRGQSCRVVIEDRNSKKKPLIGNRLANCLECLARSYCGKHRSVEPPALCVRDIFGGKMSMRTRCLSCGVVASRGEIFEDIALPINQSYQQFGAGFDWIIAALDEVEKLQGDNQYHCDLCGQLTDVERSVHYVTSPRILTLHLKRFSAQSSLVKKTVDNVNVPLLLPCLHRDCRLSPVTSASHWYELYAVVAHSGRLATSGHYIAYVRDKEQTGTISSPTAAAQTVPGLQQRVSLRSKSRHLYPGCQSHSPSTVSPHLSVHLAAIGSANREERRRWLECDDDTVNVLTETQFEAKLKNAGKLTPYMLFYEKRVARPRDDHMD